MTDQTESASEYAELLADIDFYELEGDRSVLDSAIAAIRALEAKVREFEDAADIAKSFHNVAVAERNYERIKCDRLAGEVESLRSQLETALALKNQERERSEWFLKRIAEGQALMPSPPMLFLDQSAEVTRLTTEVAALRPDAERYRWLRDNYREPLALVQITQHYTPEGLDAAIDAARRAGEGEVKP